MSKEEKQLRLATQEYLARKHKRAHPSGRSDNGGRWYPSADEHRPCCDKIRQPSRAYPFSLLKHCRSMKHVAALYGVEELALRRQVRELENRRNSIQEIVEGKARFVGSEIERIS